jgi:hypothetical protein
MADAFVSYSRKDQAFVRTLHDALAGAKRDVWVDWEDIPPSAEWLREIEPAIEAADTFIFVLSPDSLSSKACRDECDHATRYNKRMVPLVVRDVAHGSVPDRMARLNWLFFRGNDSFGPSFAQLIKTIDTDLAWVKAHSRLLVRAREWETRDKDKSYLLAGTDLDEAEKWLAHSGVREPATSSLQIAYVVASRQRATELQRNQLRGFYLVSLIYGAVQTFVSYFVVFDQISETGLMYLSPIWVLGLVFGIFGLTLGRTSLKRSLIATITSALLLYAFFIVVWPML